MINSVEEYLQLLSKELAESDPALIQEALSDSEEYLRMALDGAMGADPSLPEAEALASIIEKYGSPGEVASAYREGEKDKPGLQEQRHKDVPFASRWARLGAAIIDLIVMVAISLPIHIVVSGILDFSELLSPLISVAIYLVINGYLLAKNGQTVGKLALGIKIVRSNREKISFGRIVGLRCAPIWILTSIPFIGLLISLVDVLLVFREEKNCLHDDIADTRVVKA